MILLDFLTIECVEKQDASGFYIFDKTPLSLYVANNLADLTAATKVCIEFTPQYYGSTPLEGDTYGIVITTSDLINDARGISGFFVASEDLKKVNPSILYQYDGEAYAEEITDGLYKVELFVKYLYNTLDYVATGESQKWGFHAIVRNCVLTSIKNFDWKNFYCSNCECKEYPLPWRMHDILYSLEYSNELKLWNNYELLIDKLKKLCHQCSTSSIPQDGDCNCN